MWAFALGAIAQVARVVLDACTGPSLAHHLHVEVRALAQPLRLGKAPTRFEQLHTILELGLDGDERTFICSCGVRVMRRRKVGELVAHGQDLAGKDIEVLMNSMVSPMNSMRVAITSYAAARRRRHRHAKARAPKVHVVAGVSRSENFAQEDVATPRLSALHGDQLPEIVLRRPDAVDAGDRGHHHDIAPGQRCARRTVAQPVDLVVPRQVLLDIRIGARDVGLGLVEVVDRDGILDGVLRKDSRNSAQSCAASVFFSERASVGRCCSAMTLAMVKVCPTR